VTGGLDLVGESRPAPAAVATAAGGPTVGGSRAATGHGRRRRRHWFSRLALRNRMAVLVGIAVTCGIAVVAGVALAATNLVLRNSIDTQLLQQAEVAANTTQFFVADGHKLLVLTPGIGLPLQVVRSDGQPVPPYNKLYSVALPIDSADVAIAQNQTGQSVRTITLGGKEYRLATVPLQPSATSFLLTDHPPTDLQLGLQLARPMSDVHQTLRELALVMLGVGLFGVAGSMLAGMFVARAALKPVDAAAAAAEHVARTQDLSALIPVTGTDEIARLAESLNSMLRALEASKARQRQLVDDASHELRTPLTSLRTNIELLIRSEANPTRALPAADRAALLSDVDGQMRELTGLVSELVELARDEAPVEEVERLDLAEVVAAAVIRARRRATTKDIVIEVTSAPSWVDGRPNLLERAVTNLLDNAVKFSPANSTIRVRTGAGEVIVSDEGPGIAPADQQHVFERFYRSADARSLPGSGLGLAIVADAVRAHGGTVSAGTAPGGGALMRMRLPLAAGPLFELPAPPGTGSSPPAAPTLGGSDAPPPADGQAIWSRPPGSPAADNPVDADWSDPGAGGRADTGRRPGPR